MAAGLPRSVLIKQYKWAPGFFAYADELAGIPHSVIVEEDVGVHNPMARIEVEPAKSDARYIHLRFSHANKYLARRDKMDGVAVANSDKPEEDTSKPSCTLFEPVKADDNGNVYLIHVHTGWHAQYDGLKRMCVVNWNNYEYDKLTFVDAESIFRLPEHVAFKGDNGKYLQVLGVTINKHPFLQFSCDDPYNKAAGFHVVHLPDGYVRIKSDHSEKFWRLSPAWIWADESRDRYLTRLEDVFWPTKIDDKTVAFRNGANSLYCMRLSADHNDDCLNACDPNTRKETRLEVVELVQERKYYGVVYRMESARIFNESPYVGGSTTAINKGDKESSMEVQTEYKVEKSTSFSHSYSLGAGVSANIEASVPFITKGSVQVSYNATATFECGKTETTTTTLTAKGVVPVPPRSMGVVHYVGTKGTCNIPYSYSQADRSATDGKMSYSVQNDGMYTGIDCYNFEFVMDKAIPL